MNNSLYCSHNILLSQRCPRCVVERRVSYSNRLQNLMDLSNYENRLLNYEESLLSYRDNIIDYIELQIRNKILADINYLLSVISRNSTSEENINIRRFYNNITRELNLFNPHTYHLRIDNDINERSELIRRRATDLLNYTSERDNIIRRTRSNILTNYEDRNNINRPPTRSDILRTTRYTDNILRSTNNLLSNTNRYLNTNTLNNSIVERNNNRNNENLRYRTPTSNNNAIKIKDLNQYSKLEIYTREENSEEQSCMICLENIESNTIVRKLNCTHYFHYECVDRWFETNKSCPVCRYGMSEVTMV